MEWSGILFYRTEGEFAEDDFKIIAEEMIPADIGSATYTEYDPGDPSIIKILMENPRLLDMKRGHIHSHNNMAVFFSGTDNDELAENCPFYNFYLSLIVNNRNEMVAKIAFKTETISETQTIIKYRNQDGEERTREFETSEESEQAYTYSCRITLPELVEASFNSRFQEIQKAKEEASKKVVVFSGNGHSNDKAYQGFDVNKRYEQAGLYDDIHATSETPDEEKTGGYVKRGGIYVRTRNDSPEELAMQEAIEREYGPVEDELDSYGFKKGEKPGKWEKGSNKGMLDIEPDDEISVQPNTRRVYDMLSKLLNLSFSCEKGLDKTLQELDRALYHDQRLDDKTYFQTLENRAPSFYIEEFPEDQKMHFLDDVMQKAIEVLETYDDKYPALIFHINETLNLVGA